MDLVGKATKISAARAAVAAAGVSLLATGCGGGQAPVYVLRQTDPALQYRYASQSSQTVSTPSGPASSAFGTDAIMRLEIGEATGASQAFSVRFDSFGASISSQMGSRILDGSSVTGPEFRGIVADDGEIRLTQIPEVTVGSYDQNSLAAIFPDLLTPLPPRGEVTGESWPHAFVLPTGGGLTGETSYSGKARFAGDTLWNGIEARLIISEGPMWVEGVGTPDGAPAEISLTVAGETISTYVWDPGSGVLLAMQAESRGKGTVSTMGLELPIELQSARSAELVP